MGCSNSTLCQETQTQHVPVTDRGTSLGFLQSFAEEAFQAVGVNVTIASLVEKASGTFSDESMQCMDLQVLRSLAHHDHSCCMVT